MKIDLTISRPGLMSREQLVEYCSGESAVRMLEEDGLKPCLNRGRTVRWSTEEVDAFIGRAQLRAGREGA